mmetsp:Transcript_33719/g.94887  ORF Transcript_33719/g.94887 Transcript_33719/m.94887 type:complete len:269 (-) Transcript_33719:1026-1832(-)
MTRLERRRPVRTRSTRRCPRSRRVRPLLAVLARARSIRTIHSRVARCTIHHRRSWQRIARRITDHWLSERGSHLALAPTATTVRNNNIVFRTCGPWKTSFVEARMCVLICRTRFAFKQSFFIRIRITTARQTMPRTRRAVRPFRANVAFRRSPLRADDGDGVNLSKVPVLRYGAVLVVHPLERVVPHGNLDRYLRVVQRLRHFLHCDIAIHKEEEAIKEELGVHFEEEDDLSVPHQECRGFQDSRLSVFQEVGREQIPLIHAPSVALH